MKMKPAGKAEAGSGGDQPAKEKGLPAKDFRDNLPEKQQA
jgi:hypothetical protein